VDEDLAEQCPRRRNIGIELTDEHWKVIRFLRDDFAAGRDRHPAPGPPRHRRIPTKELFALFPKKPAKKMAYIAGLPKPVGCV
jgi:sulfur relay (sulfurtransferase) DsrC/TusE family protein